MEEIRRLNLSKIEKTILVLLSQGLTKKEVALHTNKSIYCVDKYLRCLFEKFDVKSTVALIAIAIRTKHIE